MEVQIIQAATNQAHRRASEYRLKVAAYCRVSTENEEQESSYEAQCLHYTSFIQSNPAWCFAGIYADHGISGTQMKHRDDFNRMMADCAGGKIELILTKSISRFSRNTVDCLQSIRTLKSQGVAVFFEKENINTLDTKGEVMITIMASIAQQESQSLSQNVRMGWQYAFQQGYGTLNTARFLGLNRGTKRGELVIDPEAAPIVRRIYREFLNGYTAAMIARGMEADGIRSAGGKAHWYPSVVFSMLENEKYCGDVLSQKYYVEDFLTHRLRKNDGALPQYFVENHHDPIVPRQVYLQVQGELMRRTANKGDPSQLPRADHVFLNRLYCGRCGVVMHRYWKKAMQHPDWRCGCREGNAKRSLKEKKSSCGCPYVSEPMAQGIVITAMNQLPERRDELLRMQGALEGGEIRRIDIMMQRSQAEEAELTARRQALSREDGHADELAFLDRQINRLHEERDAMILEKADYANRAFHIRLLMELMEEMSGRAHEEKVQEESPDCRDYEDFLRRTRTWLPRGTINGQGQIVRFAEEMVLRHVHRIVIQESCAEVELHAGITLRQALKDF